MLPGAEARSPANVCFLFLRIGGTGCWRQIRQITLQIYHSGRVPAHHHAASQLRVAWICVDRELMLCFDVALPE